MLGLKGVSKSVIELHVSDNAYFERAVFYLKPNCNGIPARALHREAEKWIGEIIPQRKRFSVGAVKLPAVMLGSGALGACISALVITLLR